MANRRRGQFGITHEQYEVGKSQRLAPQDIKVSVGYILRVMNLTYELPPFAVEIFGKVNNITELRTDGWSQIVSLYSDKRNKTFYTTLNDEGFIVTNNIGHSKDAQLPDGYINIGYYLGSASLSDVDLAMLTSKPLEIVSA